MTKYIDLQAAVNAIKAMEWHDFEEDHFPDAEYAYNDGLIAAMNAVAAVPAADVVEVRHGKWIDTSTKRECPLCGTAWRWSDNEADRFRYCPNCGAKMGKEGKG